MKDLFLSYELSVEFKKLGFDEKCFATYSSNNKELTGLPLIDMEDKPCNALEYSWQNSKIHPTNITAPLYSQIFDWVREKHNINAWISCFQHKDDLFIDGTYSYFIYKDKQYIADQVDFETYKKAEIECIKQIIKLLK